MSRLRNPFRADPTIDVEAWRDTDECSGITVYRWQVYRNTDELIEAGSAKTKLGWVLKLWLVAMRHRVIGVAA